MQQRQDWDVVFRSEKATTPAERKTVAAIRAAMGGGVPIDHASRQKKLDKSADGEMEADDLPILNPAMRQRLIQARCKRNLNQQALATACNLRLQVIQELETGKPVAQPGVLQRLSKVLGSDLRLRFGKTAVVADASV